MGLLLDKDHCSHSLRTLLRRRGTAAWLREMRVMRDLRGSMTLEAAILLPLILTFILALTSFVKLSLSEAGLRTAVSQATQQLAVQAYPLSLLADTLGEHELLQKLQQWQTAYQDGQAEATDWLHEYGPLIPPQLREAMEAAIRTSEQLEDRLTEPIRRAFHPLLAHYLPDHLETDQLTISSLYYPILSSDSEQTVMLEAEYDVIIRLPFFTRVVTLRATAAERMWLGS